MASAEGSSGSSGDEYRLALELKPPHESGVRGAAVLHDGTAVTGGEDRTVKIWPPNGSGGFADPIFCIGFEHMIRCIVAIPVRDSFPEGGFAVGCHDTKVTLWGKDGTLVRTLHGHSGGVVDLGWTASGSLLSGAWDGTARVWNVDTGDCEAEMGGHENAVCVLGLPNGDIATGSSGVNENNKHVGFKVRIWRAGAIVKTLEDHGGPVRCLTLVPAVGFSSSSNDGTTKLRTLDGTVVAVLANPPAGDKLGTAYHTLWAEDRNELITSNEDTVLRVYRDNALAQEIPHPGTPWASAALPNGDLLTVCNQAGTSRIGHAYVWTKDPVRFAGDDAMAEFSIAMTPPAAGDSGPSEGTTLGGDDMPKSLGPYEHRDNFRGRAAGSIGYFHKPDGSLWMCSWDAAAATWQDFGEVEGVVGGTSFDIERMVTVETPDGGLSNMQIKFNLGDDPGKIARDFIQANGVNMDEFEQVREFVVAEQHMLAKRRGVEVTGMSSGAASVVMGGAGPTAAAMAGPPVLVAYVTVAKIQFDKALDKLLEFNTEVGASAPSKALDDGEATAVRRLVAVLKETSRYHSSKVTADMRGAVGKLLGWPVQFLLPALDLLRVLVTHPHGAEVFETFGSAAVAGLLAAAKDPSAPAGVVLLTPRLMFNMFGQQCTRRLAGAMLTDFVSHAKALFGDARKNVRNAATFLLCNCSRFLKEARGQAPSSFADSYTAAANLTLDAAKDAISVSPSLEPGPLTHALESAANVAALSPSFAAYARDQGVMDAAAAPVAAAGTDAAVGAQFAALAAAIP